MLVLKGKEVFKGLRRQQIDGITRKQGAALADFTAAREVFPPATAGSIAHRYHGATHAELRAAVKGH